jgi:PIN domain nuclease of toxin-antitoxin system
MKVVNLYTAKTQLSSLVEEAAAGAEIVIAKAGVPRARLVAARAAARRRPGGSKGRIRIAADFDAPLPQDSPRLGAGVRRAIATADVVWVSAASGWEVAIKQALGKLTLADSFVSMVESSDFDQLAITFRHAERLTTLPPHHSDPFDRMLVAQTQVEGVTLVTHDPHFKPYDIPIVWT